ncbi:MAG: FesM [Vicinamibacteraceae bacterium]
MSDLLTWPVVGAVLRWRHLRTATRTLLLVVAVALVAHGLFGPQFAPTNLATLGTWIHYRGLLIGVLLVAGNAFCHACPMILARDMTRKVWRPRLRWPGRLHGKWLALPLFAAVLFAYEAFDLWAVPAATAWLIVGYFAGAIVVDTLFSGAAFCKHICPVGQFNFVASTLSPLEIRAKDGAVCASCRTFDCLKGRRAPAAPAIVTQRGCELHLFVPTKTGNLECTFCLDCVQACPYDNVALATRVPGDELTDDRRRSVIGRLSRRLDIAALTLLFTFGALLNAFAMTGPVHGLGRWLATGLGATSDGPPLAVLFVVGLGVLPLALCALAAYVTHLVGGARATFTPVRYIAASYAYALVPIGAGVWLAHYAFHFLTGLGTIVPVAQGAAIDAVGWAILGEPSWGWLGMRPGLVFPLQVGAVILGGIGATSLIQRISERDYHGHAAEAGAPWVVIAVGLTTLALWILMQPMDMRGTGFLS